LWALHAVTKIIIRLAANNKGQPPHPYSDYTPGAKHSALCVEIHYKSKHFIVTFDHRSERYLQKSKTVRTLWENSATNEKI
ncbi:MAG: hypothetical protein KAJ19_27890, partial [Gammaproteobacteria bacterium]|nr:hypothetical protein [Gammaproteobacteria bacterium]